MGRAVVDEIMERGLGGRALTRSPAPGFPPSIEVVRGSLGDLARDSSPLRGVKTVLHLAAATGAASKDTFRDVNSVGARDLVAACEREGVQRLVAVSTIAVRWDNLATYPYARTKQEGEEWVRKSALDYAIVRPTIVIAPDSPIVARLKQLAGLPVPLVLGSPRVQVQPVDARDLSGVLVDLADQPALGRRTLEVGGRETVSMGELVASIRTILGKAPKRPVHIPLGPVWMGLSIAELVTFGRFPVTTAQLSSFKYDGVAEPDPFITSRAGGFRSLADSLAWSLGR